MAYAVGVAIGTIAGLAVDERLSAGQSELRVMVPGLQPLLLDGLKRLGCPGTSVTAEGPDGPVTLLFVTVNDRRLAAFVATVRRMAPLATWTVHPLGHEQRRRLAERSAQNRCAAAS